MRKAKKFSSTVTAESTDIVNESLSIDSTPVEELDNNVVVDLIPEKPIEIKPTKEEQSPAVEKVKQYKKVAIETDCGLKIIEVEI